MRAYLLQGLQGSRTERDDYSRVDDVDRHLKVERAVGEFLRGGRAVIAGFSSGIAEEGVRYKDVLTSPTDSAKEPLKIITGLVAAKGDARPIRSQAAWGLGDKEKGSVEIAVVVRKDFRTVAETRTVTTVKPNTVILHSPDDETIPFADSQELLHNSGFTKSALIVVGTDHRLADPEPLAVMLEMCERVLRRGQKS